MGAKNELSEKWFCEIFYTLGQCLIDLGSASLITFLLWSIGSITNRCWGNEAAFLAAEMEPTGRQEVPRSNSALRAQAQYEHLIMTDRLLCPWGNKALTFSLNSTRLIRTPR